MSERGKPDYGIDAPGVIRGLLLFGAAGVLVYASLARQGRINAGPHLHLGNIELIFPVARIALSTGIGCLASGLLMLIYAKWGKTRHRDRMLALYNWRGNERVLDVGTGRGLMLIGAAKKLGLEGRATGIDIWRAQDLSGNTANATTRNIETEGVSGRCELVSMPAQKMTFPDAMFDVVVSNLCIHNIPARADRDEACREIMRVLKPGGVAIISDYKNTGDYAKVFRAARGTVVSHYLSNLFTTFPPLRILEVKKPGEARSGK